MSAAPDPSSEPEDFREVEQRLAHLGERIREKMLREGAALTDERTERAGREALRRMLAEETGRGPRRPWWGIGLVLGSAAALILVVFLLKAREPRSDPIPLGPVRVHLLHPLGEVREFDRFEWEAELPPGGSFLLILRDAARPDSPPREFHLEESRWVPDVEERLLLPRELEWEVRVLDALGKIVGSDRSTAARAE